MSQEEGHSSQQVLLTECSLWARHYGKYRACVFSVITIIILMCFHPHFEETVVKEIK